MRRMYEHLHDEFAFCSTLVGIRLFIGTNEWQNEKDETKSKLCKCRHSIIIFTLFWCYRFLVLLASEQILGNHQQARHPRRSPCRRDQRVSHSSVSAMESYLHLGAKKCRHRCETWRSDNEHWEKRWQGELGEKNKMHCRGALFLLNNFSACLPFKEVARLTPTA